MHVTVLGLVLSRKCNQLGRRSSHVCYVQATVTVFIHTNFSPRDFKISSQLHVDSSSFNGDILIVYYVVYDQRDRNYVDFMYC